MNDFEDWERLVAPASIVAAARIAARASPRAHETCAFMLDLATNAAKLSRDLASGEYRPGAYRTFTIRDPKPRVISAAHFRDRVVQHALIAVIEPALERAQLISSFACREGMGTSGAWRSMRAGAARHEWALRMDVRHFFETLDHKVLAHLLKRRVRDPRVLALATVFVAHQAPGSLPGKGVPIGNLTSQHFANLYLTPLDRFVCSTLRPARYVRYMDDLVLFGPDSAFLIDAANKINEFAARRLALTMKERATQIHRVSAGVPFLGFRFFPAIVRLDQARRRRFLRAAARARRAHAETPNASAPGESLRAHIAWIAQANTLAFRRSVLAL